ncbi:hypothetical protein AKJ50_02305 [candidate division MSBL1 archaeon SCGC-AAA382A13]|uniref:Uncharacterized protein n=1 Tax=candidate division MSBL1 archaeon SCGC-AAA382A13 TaxID=1698279 RepID=A0A133VDL4_9EURY|nr:hypothetical protein AKJ50_02305 [candidate division MSBL1 archaeon SCGC-AAA382A13]
MEVRKRARVQAGERGQVLGQAEDPATVLRERPARRPGRPLEGPPRRFVPGVQARGGVVRGPRPSVLRVGPLVKGRRLRPLQFPFFSFFLISWTLQEGKRDVM